MATVPVSAEDSRAQIVTDWDPFSNEAMNGTARAPRYYADGWAGLRKG
jgi:hypothetical protein